MEQTQLFLAGAISAKVEVTHRLTIRVTHVKQAMSCTKPKTNLLTYGQWQMKIAVMVPSNRRNRKTLSQKLLLRMTFLNTVTQKSGRIPHQSTPIGHRVTTFRLSLEDLVNS